MAYNSLHIEEENVNDDRNKRQLDAGTINYLKNVQKQLKE